MTTTNTLHVLAIAFAAACGSSYPVPGVPRTCTESQHRESVDCKTYDFEVRFSTDKSLLEDAQAELFHNATTTECGCIQNLDAAVDAAAQRGVRCEIVAPCHCTHQR